MTPTYSFSYLLDFFPKSPSPDSISPESLPIFPKTKTSSDEQARYDYWSDMRSFFRSEKGGRIPADHLPALLGTHRNTRLQLPDYPLWLPEGSDESPVVPLREQLARWNQLAAQPLEEAQLIQLQERVHAKIGFADTIFKAYPVLLETLEEIRQESPEAMEGWESLFPKNGLLLPFSPLAPLHLAAHFVGDRAQSGRTDLLQEVEELKRRLHELLAVEREKEDESHSASRLQESLDFAGEWLDFEALSTALPSGEAQRIPHERLHRLQKLLQRLEAADELLGHPAYLLRGPGLESWSLRDDFPNGHLREVEAGNLCREAEALFEERMASAARLFAAMRMARLEAEDHYRTDLHVDFFAHFNWRSFSPKEWKAAPLVLILGDSTDILNRELDEWSQLLASDRPVKALLVHRIPENKQQTDLWRREITALSIAHRNPFVLQATALCPNLLAQGLEAGLSVGAPALFHLGLPGEELEPAQADRLLISAVQGREFPHFQFDSREGLRWGERFSLENNPQPEADWSALFLSVNAGKDKVETWPQSFTFADFALQAPAYASHFKLIDPAFVTDELLPLHEYLQIPLAELSTQLPFIWSVDEEGELHRVLPNRSIIQLCRERLSFWNFLQENAGIHSVHVERATQMLEQEMEEAFSKKVEALEAEHAGELKEMESQTMRRTIMNLLSNLLDDSLETKLEAMAVSGSAGKEAPAKEKKPEQAAETAALTAVDAPFDVEEKEKPESSAGYGKAWVETELCTSCNDCINTNDHIFQYNAEKQAFIANPRGGPFADIVRAAEKCPVSIIHPGDPWNPQEPDLAKWVKRAEKFQ